MASKDFLTLISCSEQKFSSFLFKGTWDKELHNFLEVSLLLARCTASSVNLLGCCLNVYTFWVLSCGMAWV